MMRRDRNAVGAYLVRDVTVAGDAIRTDDAQIDAAGAHDEQSPRRRLSLSSSTAYRVS